MGVREEFAVDENGLTVDGYRCLPAVSKKAMYIARAIAVAVLAVFLVPMAVLLPGVLVGYELVARAVPLLLLIICAAYLSVSPIIFYRRYRYRIDDDKLEIRSGVVFIKHELVPVERIHQVEVVRGPINRPFGLADVSVTTAGGTATIQFIETEIAEDIASNLNEKIVEMLRKRDRWQTAPSVTMSPCWSTI